MLRTTGTLHARPEKTPEEISMMMKTTHSVFVPASVTNWCSGESGRTGGMGETPVGVAVGRGMSEVFLRTSSNWSTIILAVVKLWLKLTTTILRIEGWRVGNGPAAAEVIKRRCRQQLRRALCCHLLQALAGAVPSRKSRRHLPSRMLRRMEAIG